MSTSNRLPVPIFNLKSQHQRVKKTKWKPEEDKLLLESIEKNGIMNWSVVAESVPGRNGKQCRERWINQLSPTVTKGKWTEEEDSVIIEKQSIHGNQWKLISSYLPGRSLNSIKNRWSFLSRNLTFYGLTRKKILQQKNAMLPPMVYAQPYPIVEPTAPIFPTLDPYRQPFEILDIYSMLSRGNVPNYANCGRERVNSYWEETY